MYMIILVPRISLRFRQSSKYVSQPIAILKALKSCKLRKLYNPLALLNINIIAQKNLSDVHIIQT